MSTDLNVQRRYDGVELIAGIGDPALNRFCIMSFVAFMAGEYFGDRPKTASPVIRKFVIPLNDRVDAATRQRLKPFAPRIIGTNDGHDPERTEIIYQTIIDAVLPVAVEDASRTGVDRSPRHDRRSGAPISPSVPVDRLPARVRRNLEHMLAARRSGHNDILAKEAGHMLVTLAENSSQRRTWYLNKAIALLDRLCDVGAERRANPYTPHNGTAGGTAAPAEQLGSSL